MVEAAQGAKQLVSRPQVVMLLLTSSKWYLFAKDPKAHVPLCLQLHVSTHSHHHTYLSHFVDKATKHPSESIFLCPSLYKDTVRLYV